MKSIISSRPCASVSPRPQSGFSLVELMVAITIGMLVVAALLALFLNITRNNSELAKANTQIENGRFAMQLLQNDLMHAGFWGELRPAAPTIVFDPCTLTDLSSWTPAQRASLLGISVRGYTNGSALTGCGIGTVLGGSDVVAVLHANTCTAGGACDGGSDTGPHVQISACTDSAPAEPTFLVDTAPAAFTLRERDCATVAPRRKIVSNIYYLATSNGQPTLMRTSLVDGDYATQPLIEGIESLRFEYGIDTSGDGSPDSYVSTPPTTIADGLADIVAVKIHLLARNLERTPGYTDSKSYQLGGTSYTVPTTDVGFKRHVFSTTVRLVNPSGRREVP